MEFYIGIVGIMPDVFWNSTLQELVLLGQSFQNRSNEEWIRTRNIEFSIMASSFRGMNGEKAFKHLKKPKDLYELPSDSRRINRKKVKAVRDVDRALEAYNKTIKDKNKWLHKT